MPRCGETSGRSIEVELDLDMAGFNDRHAIVHLPPCYDETSGRYPVTYLLDGGGQRPESWIEEPIEAAAIADELAVDASIEPMILVMAPRSTMRHGFSEQVLEPLITIVDARYRTIPDPSGRAIGGFSVGGTVAAVTAFSGDETFAAVGLFAASWPESLGEELVDAMADRSDRPDVYIHVGDRDPYVRRVPVIESVLAELSIEPTIDVVEGVHDVAFVARYVPDWLRWFDRRLSS